jgi:hypothetical protein
MKFISLQRWIYVGGNSVPNALRALAQEIERFQDTDIPDDEYFYDYSMDSNVEISYSEDSEDNECYRAGICMSWKSVFED